MEKKQRIIVGVNEYVEPDEKIEIPIMYIGEEVEEEQKRCIAEVKRTRDDTATRRALHALTGGGPHAPGEANLMEKILDCAARVRHRGRDPRGDARGVRRLHRTGGVLMNSGLLVGYSRSSSSS
jgi:methylmalonyl-CoA mutase N-terminal domain/subunit